MRNLLDSIVGVMGKTSEDEEMLSPKLRLSLLLEIEEGDVMKALLHLNPNKARGTDGTSAKVLRMVAPGICGSLTDIVNSCLKEGCNPEEWKSANISLVHKGGLPQITDRSPSFQLLLRFLTGLSTSSFMTIYRKTRF